MISFKRIKTILQTNKDGKVLLSNFSYLIILQIAGYVFPLLTMPYLARVIGPTGFGKIAFASAIIIWVQTVADWGFNFSATRDVAKNRDDIVKVSEIFSNVFWSRCVLMLLSFLILLALIFTIPDFRNDADIILVTFLLIPGHIMFPDWFFQAVERMKYITFLNLLAKFLFTIAVFIFIKSSNDYILQPLFNSIGFCICGIISMYIILHKWHIRLLKPNPQKIFSTIKGSTDIFINEIAPNLYNSLSVVMLSMFSGAVSTGIYDAGKKINTIMQQLLQIIARVFFPFLNRKPNKHHIYAKISLSIAAVSSIAIFIFAPELIHFLFNESFNESIIVLRITSISLIFLTISSVYGTNYLLVHHKDHLLRNITLTTSIGSLIYSVPLIYFYGYIGTAITYTLSTIIIGSTKYLYAQRIKKLQKDNH